MADLRGGTAPDYSSQIATLQAEVERLTKERDTHLRSAATHFAKSCELADRAITAEVKLSTPAPQGMETAVPKRWLVEVTLPSGSQRWSCFEHEHQARDDIEYTGRGTVTPLYPIPQPAPSGVNAEMLAALESAKVFIQHHYEPADDRDFAILSEVTAAISAAEAMPVDYLRGQIGEVLCLELDVDESSRALSQAVEKILSLVHAAPKPGGKG